MKNFVLQISVKQRDSHRPISNYFSAGDKILPTHISEQKRRKKNLRYSYQPL